jgi:hypothetical protein
MGNRVLAWIGIVIGALTVIGCFVMAYTAAALSASLTNGMRDGKQYDSLFSEALGQTTTFVSPFILGGAALIIWAACYLYKEHKRRSAYRDKILADL